MLKKYFFYTLIIFTNLVFAQSEKWKINSESSYISYSGNHFFQPGNQFVFSIDFPFCSIEKYCNRSIHSGIGKRWPPKSKDKPKTPAIS